MKIFVCSLFVSLFALTAQSARLINGAGATFPYPLYSKWFAEYSKVNKDVQINYQSIGSGGGIRQFLKRTVDFGASDVPMKDSEVKKADTAVLHIPTVLGAVSIAYNLPEVAGLKLDATTTAEIFLGNITKWSDAKIAALNPGKTFPNTPILVARRSDGSGTTGVFTDYLSKVSPAWNSKVGKGKAVKWPTGLGGKGNEGVAGLIKQTKGAIGYVEVAYAKKNQLSVVALKNRSGEFVLPSPATVSAAGKAVLETKPINFKMSLTDSPSKGAYPISAFTYILVYKTMPKETGSKIVSFLRWAIADGQKMAEPLHYSPLPKPLLSKVSEEINSITFKE